MIWENSRIDPIVSLTCGRNKQDSYIVPYVEIDVRKALRGILDSLTPLTDLPVRVVSEELRLGYPEYDWRVVLYDSNRRTLFYNEYTHNSVIQAAKLTKTKRLSRFKREDPL